MPKTYACPFWKWENGLSMSCECCRMDFPDKDTKSDYAQQYCASVEGWKNCSVARALNEFYEKSGEENGTKPK